MTDETQPGGAPLDAERQRMRAQGYTDTEISQILVSRALGGGAGSSNSAATPPQGMFSNVLSSIVAVAGYAGGLFTTVRHDITTILDRSAAAGARVSAFVAIAIKAVVIGALAFAAWQEWQQHVISATQTAASNAELTAAQAKKMKAEADAAEQVAAGEKAKSCSERMQLLTQNMYIDDLTPNGGIKPGTATARMMDKYNRECGGITGSTPEAAPPASMEDAAKAKDCGEKFDALFGQLQQVDKTDNTAVDKLGIRLFTHRQNCPITDDQQAKLDTMSDMLTASNERIKTMAAAALFVRQSEKADKEFKAGDYATAYATEKQVSEYAEQYETRTKGRAGPLTAGVLVSLSWYALFAHDYDGAIAAADRAVELESPNLVALTNKAHALMFLGRDDEAKAIYRAHRSEKIDAKRGWNEAIIGDFAEFRKAGLTQPLMDEVERDLSGQALAAGEPPAPAYNAPAPPDVPQTPPALRTPSNFDCVNGKHMGTDFVICASPVLLDAEARLEEAYHAVRSGANGDRVKAEQLDWIKHYGPDCGLPYRGRPAPGLIDSAAPCIRAKIEQRIQELRQE